MNKQEAVRTFVDRSFNYIPLSLVERAYDNALYEKIVLPEEPSYEDFDLEDEYEPEFDEIKPEEPTIVMPQRKDFDNEDDYEDALAEYENIMSDYQDLLNEYENTYIGWQWRYERWEKYQSAHGEWEQLTESDNYPMWGTLFECSDSWMSGEILDNLQGVYDCGFTVMDDFEELNVCLGVAGAGYDFYEAHFEPLYDLLGLHWHDYEEKDTKVV